VSYSLPLTRSEAIARHLREEIVTGQLGPGTVIKDAELADRLGVSITPVREASLRSGNVATATSAGADFSTIMISASGNRELQTHVDLVVTRMRRLLGLTPQSNHWRPWIDGYTEVLVLLEHGDAQAAMARYRRIYAEVRADLESGEAAAQGLETASPDPLR
jgi:DNA-binding GntR family transcriptional regulator